MSFGPVSCSNVKFALAYGGTAVPAVFHGGDHRATMLGGSDRWCGVRTHAGGLFQDLADRDRLLRSRLRKIQEQDAATSNLAPRAAATTLRIAQRLAANFKSVLACDPGQPS
ncbi:hypothetical protein Pla100_28450 [Neorhodopirellula pilleata]|uniref:Uncharacterized protein n=1 Tax=Neorhodopirellula pilleata TaxID=2714738 RepID=A0A5C6AAI2_9BACT|nr:hypothetical protein Pla100_28450 [Neorhodopirellula pilleata]